MIDLTGVTHNPIIEEMVDVLCAKTQNTNRNFFRAEVAFFLAKMASSMRAAVVTKDIGEVPASLYVMALATSGFGKGHSVFIVENEFLHLFKKRFTTDTFPKLLDQNLNVLAAERAAGKANGDVSEELSKLQTEARSAGTVPFAFDSGSAPAAKQLRHKLLLAGCGAINLQIDEIGSNLVGSTELLNLFLELFDQGTVKQKITKNTAESQRAEELDGKTPANLLMFGTPANLFDGSQTEDTFFSFLETGYARRCLFGFGQQEEKAFHTQSAADMYYARINSKNQQATTKWALHFETLADPAMFNWKVHMDDAEAIMLEEYKIACEIRAQEMKEHETIRKAEMCHRYYRVLKLCGTLGFVQHETQVTKDTLLQAMLLVEESGKAFEQILVREKPYMKLARYVCDQGTNSVTHADLHEALPFYKSSNAARNELMTMAIAWGYKNHMIIKKQFVDGIEFYSGEKLEKTDLNKLILSYSNHVAYNYETAYAPFNELTNLVTQQGFHWVNHHLLDGHRLRDKIVAGFNMLVIDIDEGTSLETAHELLADYTFMTYTTKRHQITTVDDHGVPHTGPDRYRVIIPINYTLKLDHEDYQKLYENVMAAMPFTVWDEGSNQRERKWETFAGTQVHYNEGELFDILPFIPRTSRNEEFLKEFQKVESLDNLERWFAQRIANGNRNKNMIKYALALVDNGCSLAEVEQLVHSFNKKLKNPLDTAEIDNTIMVTVSKKYI